MLTNSLGFKCKGYKNTKYFDSDFAVSTSKDCSVSYVFKIK